MSDDLKLSDFRKGETKVIKIDYGADTDITGWSFKVVFKKKSDQVHNDLEIETTAGDEVLDDPMNGLAYLIIDSTTSLGLDVGKYFYSVKRIKPGSPQDIKTIAPPDDEYNERITVYPYIG